MKDGAKFSLDDFWYDLTDGGYLEPEKLLEDKADVERLVAAIAVVREFEQALVDAEEAEEES